MPDELVNVHCNVCDGVTLARPCDVFKSGNIEYHCLGCDSHENNETEAQRG